MLVKLRYANDYGIVVGVPKFDLKKIVKRSINISGVRTVKKRYSTNFQPPTNNF